MKVETFSGVHECVNESDLERLILDERFDFDSNSYWMGAPTFPQMVVLVCGERAYAHFLPEEGHPGFRSDVGIASCDETALFYCDRSCQTVEVIFSAVISIGEAKVAAKYFF